MWTDPLDAAGLAGADGVRRIVATISISSRDSTCRLDAEYPTTGHGIIDGRRDLAGFFPAHLDIKQLRALFPTGAQFAYKLKHANQGVNPFPRPDATGYQTDYNKAGQILSGLTFRVDAAGLSGPSASLNSIATEDKGVFLLEGRTTTTELLVLSVQDFNGSVVWKDKMPLRVDGVRAGAVASGAGETSAAGGGAGELPVTQLSGIAEAPQPAEAVVAGGPGAGHTGHSARGGGREAALCRPDGGTRDHVPLRPQARVLPEHRVTEPTGGKSCI